MKPYLNSVSGKSNLDVTNFSGGLNGSHDKASIRDNQLAYVWNMTLDKSPTLRTRQSRTSLAWFMRSKRNYAKGQILKMFAPSSKTLYTIESKNYGPEHNPKPEFHEEEDLWNTTPEHPEREHMPDIEDIPTIENNADDTIPEFFWDDEPEFVFDDVEPAPDIDWGDNYIFEYRIVNGKIEKRLIATIHSSDRYSMCECRDSNNKYLVVSTPKSRHQFTITETSMTGSNYYSNAGIVACHKNRLWVASGNTIKFSSLSQYDNFTIYTDEELEAITGEKERSKKIYEGAGEIQITNAKGDITAMVSYDGKLMIFCDNSRHIIYGDSPFAEVNQFSLYDFDDGVGCVNDECLTICSRQLCWLDSDMSIYKYDGSYTTKINEPYGSREDYASYGGISDIELNRVKVRDYSLEGCGNKLYFVCRRSTIVNKPNDTIFIYDMKNRVWTAEDGEFNHIVKWETDANTPFYNTTDYIVASKYNGDIIILNSGNYGGVDVVFDSDTMEFSNIPIKYGFETKVWNLGTIKNKKTLTNVWFQADAKADVSVGNFWEDHNIWDTEYITKDKYLKLGELKPASIRHDIFHEHSSNHEGEMRQRLIVQRMFMQKINTFSIRVDGEGEGVFHLMEKEWRIR